MVWLSRDWDVKGNFVSVFIEQASLHVTMTWHVLNQKTGGFELQLIVMCLVSQQELFQFAPIVTGQVECCFDTRGPGVLCICRLAIANDEKRDNASRSDQGLGMHDLPDVLLVTTNEISVQAESQTLYLRENFTNVAITGFVHLVQNPGIPGTLKKMLSLPRF